MFAQLDSTSEEIWQLAILLEQELYKVEGNTGCFRAYLTKLR